MPFEILNHICIEFQVPALEDLILEKFDEVETSVMVIVSETLFHSFKKFFQHSLRINIMA
jgi:hypothetical protein